MKLRIKKVFNKNTLIVVVLLIILIALQVPLVKPFFHSGFFATHDGVQTVRIFEYYQSLRYGQIPPRWSSGLLYGHGYPLFIFYSPLTYLLGSIFVFLGFNFLLATKIVFILGFLMGAAGMFFLIRSFVGNFPAFIASIIYSLIPYRAVDVYVRGDLAEFFAYSFFPWLFWVNLKLLKNPKNIFYIYLLALAIGIMTASHNISTLIYALFLGMFNLLYIFKYIKKEKISIIKKLLFSGFLAALISCFYWLPLLAESHFVQLDKFAHYPYNQYFLTFEQIWQSPWRYGGFIEKDPMSLQLGQVIIIVSLITLFLNLVIKTNFRSIIFFISGVFVFSTFFETRVTQFIWDRVTLFHYLQFPWRFHILNTLCGVLLIGFFFYLFKNSKIYYKKIGRISFVILGIIFIFLSFKESYSFFRAKSYSDENPVSETTTWNDEYMPKWVKSKPKDYAPDKIKFLGDIGRLENIEWGYNQKKFTSINEKGTHIIIAQVYYPGWKAYINNKRIYTSYDNDQGLMEINLPKGKNDIVFIFERTWWRWIADITSIAGISITLILIFISLFKRLKRPSNVK